MSDSSQRSDQGEGEQNGQQHPPGPSLTQPVKVDDCIKVSLALRSLSPLPSSLTLVSLQT